MTANLPSDPLTALSHKLIRAACGDDFDPFMIGSAPDEGGPVVRACFYYGVVVTPRTTVVFDNGGRGGMCDFVPEEMVAAWDTPSLLASQGMRLDALHEGAAPDPAIPVPSPRQIDCDLPPLDGTPSKQSFDGPVWSPRYEGRVRVSDLLRSDPEMLSFLIRRADPGPDQPMEPETAAAPRRPRMG